MTPQEAIEALKLINLKSVHPFYSWEEMLEVRNIAIEALEKQIPKKVHRYDVNPSEKFCPNCGLSIENKGGYCAECGQALDWSDME